MDLLAGIGERETLRDDRKYNRGGDAPRGAVDEIRLEDDDGHADMDDMKHALNM